MTERNMQVMYFSAKWCPSCKKMEPKVRKLEKEFDFQFDYLNVDDNPNMVSDFKIKSIPTILILRDGEEIERIVGESLITPLRSTLKKVIKEKL